MSSRLLASLNKVATAANVHSFMLFGRVIIVSIIILSSIFIAVLPILLPLLPNQSAFATFPGENGTKIAFTSTIDGSEEIYVMNAHDGSDQTKLTNTTDVDEFPDWSPNSTKIAFTRNIDIYVMNAHDGSDQTNLSNNAALDTHPSWSPDGTKIAFTSTRDGNNEIYVMNAHDGSDQTNLSNNAARDSRPSWSPDGTKIAFTSTRDSNEEIYVMNAHDGSNQTRLTNNVDVDRFPDWSTAATGPE
jgi:Tol biopolymer transport system component